MGASVGTCQGEGWPNCAEALRCERCGDCKEGWRQQPGFVRTQSVVDQVYSHADAQDEVEAPGFVGSGEGGWNEGGWLGEAGPSQAWVGHYDYTEVEGEAHAPESLVRKPPDVDPAAAQAIKAFVKDYVRGKTVEVVMTTGDSVDCTITLNKKLTLLGVQRADRPDLQKRTVPLEDIKEVRADSGGVEHLGVEADELCVTLLLEDGAAIVFRFDSTEERDSFVSCMGMCVDGRRSELAKQRKKSTSSSKGSRQVAFDEHA
mmetsp:Transcript_16563/g.45872  ORF Transcript_16563/g.45872 Transcript_16563/m.45872 type:complete len:260 (+) Transcript_16563:49-828(+)